MHGDCNRQEIIGGKYRILELLGAGGFGKVYKVKDEHIDKEYAMKVQPLQGRENRDGEVEMLRMLEHSGLPSLHDIISDRKCLYIVMDIAQGISLEHYVKKVGKLSVKETIQISRQLCEIIRYLHSRPIPVIHGDLKPANIMVDDHKVRLIDFGCAVQAYSKGIVLRGTPGYVAPELSRGELTTRNDVYSFGAILFYMLIGRNTDFSRLGELKKELKRYGIPRKLRKILCKCLQLQPELRYPSGVELNDVFVRTKSREGELPGMTSAGIAMLFRLAGILMLLNCLVLYIYSGRDGVDFIINASSYKMNFIQSIAVILLAIPFDVIASARYKTAVLECEYSILVTEKR